MYIFRASRRCRQEINVFFVFLAGSAGSNEGSVEIRTDWYDRFMSGSGILLFIIMWYIIIYAAIIFLVHWYDFSTKKKGKRNSSK